MLGYIARRLMLAGGLAWGAVTLVFFLIHLVPGDVMQILLAEGGVAAPDIVQARRHSLGLDRPLAIQYRDWLTGVVRLDLGASLATQRPIAPDIGTALPRTLELVGAGLFVGVVAGIPSGIFAAARRGKLGDVGVMILSLSGLAVPNFVTGTLLVLSFGLLLRWFPTAGYVSFGESPLEHLRFLVLPAAALGLTLAAITARFTRSSMLDVLGGDYIRTAYAKGLTVRDVRYRHALKNALIPVITIIGLESGSLLGGTIVVEYIFNWPGISTLLIQGANRRDFPMVQAVVMVVAGLFLVLNLIVDLVNAYVDPRIHYS